MIVTRVEIILDDGTVLTAKADDVAVAATPQQPITPNAWNSAIVELRGTFKYFVNGERKQGK